jgi:hypothetical protein
VVGEQGCVLTPAVSDPLEPGGEGGMEARTTRLRDTCVRDLARQRVPERELLLVGERRAQPPPDEVARLEQGEFGVDLVQQLAHGAAPEDPSRSRRACSAVLSVGGRRSIGPARTGVHGVGDGRT